MQNMNPRKVILKTLASVALSFLSIVAVAAAQQPGEASSPSRQREETAAETGATKTGASRNLSEEEEGLVRGSKAAVLAAGMSEPFFERHFRLVRVTSAPGDRRVVWRFAFGDYETVVNDTVGFYTDERGRRVYTHSIANTVGEARDIKRTISRRRAEQLMRRCIGEYEGGSVAYQAFGVKGRATLLFTAVSAPPVESSKKKTKPAEPPSPQPAQQVKEDGNPQDYVKPGGKKKPFRKVGSIDLETGRCTKGVAQYGAPPAPSPQK